MKFSLAKFRARPTVPVIAVPRPKPILSPLILRHEAAAAAAFTVGFDTLLNILNLDGVKEGIESGHLAEVLDVLDLLEWADFEARLTQGVTGRVVDVIEFEGQRSFDEIRMMTPAANFAATGTDGGGRGGIALPPTTFGDPMPSPGRSGFYATMRFDMTNPFAITQAERFAADLVREISNSTKRAIRDAVVDSFRTGVTADNLARRLRETIGLTSRQARAVQNYRGRLERADILGSEQIDVMVKRYWRKTRNRRAETIARTEIMRASNYGRLQGWLSAADAGMLDLNASVKEWVTAPQGVSFDSSKPTVCPSCGPMDGVKVMGVETEFRLESGRTVVMPPAHPNCRCTAIVWPPGDDYDPEYPHAEV